MLRKTFSILCAAIAAGAYAAAPADTVMSATNVDVIISETPSGLHVEATDNNGTITCDEVYPAGTTVRSTQRRTTMFRTNALWTTGKVEWDIVSGNILFGAVNASGAPAEADFEMGRSFEISWLNAVAVTCNIKSIRSGISAGVGLSWRNYRTTTGMQLLTDDNGSVSYAPFAQDVTPRYSRLKVFSLSFPVLFYHNFNIRSIPHLGVQFGPVLNWNSHASVSSKWYAPDGSKQHVSTNCVDVRHFSVDLFAAVRVFSSLGVYVRYSPQSVLLNSPDLDFSTFSTGIALGF
ncbi:MAG: hypothetical protein JFR38_03920 [Muribaculaceae bacterium]|nr:hypothetical protein [Muribaculaceae bacterium]